MELITGALAAFYSWTVLRYVLPFKLPDVLALVTYLGLAYGVLTISLPKVLIALACAGGVVFLHLLATLLGVTHTPWTPEVHLPVRRGARRVPGEAPGSSRIGRRIPRL